MDETMMQGQGGGEQMVQCPCCGQGQVPAELAEKVTQAMEPVGEPEQQDDTAARLTQAMSAKPMPMRRG